MNEHEEYNAAFDGRIGADRMAQGLPSIPTETMTRQEINEKWLKDQCNRYVNGHCSTVRCLWRAGQRPATPIDYEKATCEPHEILCELALLRTAAQLNYVAITRNTKDWQCGECGSKMGHVHAPECSIKHKPMIRG